MIIVAEIGSNHGGDLELALEHISEAARCGADAVKFQLFRAYRLDSRPEVQEKLRPFEMLLEWLPKLHRAAHDEGMKFICTPFDIESAKALRGYVDMVKISAYDLTYQDLVVEAAKLGVPVILSTAMATIEEVVHADALVRDETYLLHGVASYPAAAKDYNLLVLNTLKEWCPWSSIGISDHTIGHEVAVGATYLGADMIEKHFRSHNTDPKSPDFYVSSGPGLFRVMVNAVKRIQELLGDGEKTGPLECEMELFRTCRRTNKKTLRG